MRAFVTMNKMVSEVVKLSVQDHVRLYFIMHSTVFGGDYINSRC